MIGAAPLGVRRATTGDARGLIDLLAHLAVETDFMVVTAPHPRRDLTAVIDYLRAAAESPTNVTFVAVADAKIVGMLVTSGDLHPAKIATIDVDLGVRLDWQGRGLGRSLLAAAQEWAVSQGVHRLQLRVMTHNAPAISLYKSFGFEIEGTLRDHLKIKGRFVDQFVMAKLLG